MRKIICDNNKGQSVLIGYTSPFLLKEIDGMSMPQYTVYTSKGSTQDGENYVSSKAKKRDIDIDILVTENVIKNINLLYSIFLPKQKGTLYYYNDEIKCKVDYIVESMKISDKGYKKIVTVSLICPDPFFQDIKETKLNVAYYQGLIKFPLHLSTSPFKMTKKIKNLIANIPNDSNIDLGMTIKFNANGDVTNPSLFNINTREFYKVNTKMITGDEIVVTTHYKNKKVILTRNGLESNITHLMDYDSTWLQIYDGDNLYRYNADSNIDNLNVSIYYRQLRLGVV